MKAISLLGSTGSIGTQTLDIAAQYPDQFQIVALAAGRNVEMLAQQIRQFRPKMAAICDPEKLPELKAAIADLDSPPLLLAGEEGVVEVARYSESDVVVTGIVGCAGLLPTIAAIEAGKDIALANKETLIAGGPVVLPLVQKHGVKLLPADSEHSAIFQCLQGSSRSGTAANCADGFWRVVSGFAYGETCPCHHCRCPEAPQLDNGPQDHDRLCHLDE